MMTGEEEMRSGGGKGLDKTTVLLEFPVREAEGKDRKTSSRTVFGIFESMKNPGNPHEKKTMRGRFR